MRNGYLRLISSGALALLLAVTTSLVQADKGPLPTNSNAFGRGYDGSAAEWLEWTVAIPPASNPLFDSTGAFAAIGQSGKVWFLTGTSGQGATPPITRTVTVPTGTALFFPIVNYFWVNTPEFGDPPWSSDQEKHVRRDILKPVVDTAYGLVLEIDGQAVPNINKLRVPATVDEPITVGECTIPDDNIFGGLSLPALTRASRTAIGFCCRPYRLAITRFTLPADLPIRALSFHWTSPITSR